MKTFRFSGALVFVAVAMFLFPSHSWADNSASLKDVHDLLIKAAGDSAETMPPADQQRSTLAEALKELHHIPHFYHGDLRQAQREIESAMSEISGGDTAHSARHDILDAADLVKHAMEG